jgi:hypothetical protein
MALALSSGGKRRSTGASTNAGLLFTCGRVGMIHPMQSPSPRLCRKRLFTRDQQGWKKDRASVTVLLKVFWFSPRVESQEKESQEKVSLACQDVRFL